MPEVLQLDTEDPSMNAFSDVFSKFHELSQRKAIDDDEDGDEGDELQVPNGESAAAKKRASRKQAAADDDGDGDMDLDSEDEEANMEDPTEVRQSKKKLRKLNRMTVAQLKQLVEKPDIVEVLL